MIGLLCLPLLWAQAASSGPARGALPGVPTVVVRGVLTDARGAPVEGRVLHVGSLRGRKAFVELRDKEILNPTATTDAGGRFALVVPIAFFAAAKAFTVGVVKAATGVPPGDAQLRLAPVERNGEAAKFAYTGQRASVDLGEVRLSPDAE